MYLIKYCFSTQYDYIHKKLDKKWLFGNPPNICGHMLFVSKVIKQNIVLKKLWGDAISVAFFQTAMFTLTVSIKNGIEVFNRWIADV